MIKAQKQLRVRVTFIEELLGTAPNNPEIYSEFIASKSPDPSTLEDEVAAIGVDSVMEKAMTIFPKLEDGTPFFYDYQWKGFFKDACGMLARTPGTLSNKTKAYKKIIDGLIFVKERKIPIITSGDITTCQRPQRCSTPQGERVSLAASEAIPEGSTCEFTILCLNKEHVNLVLEWLDYGDMRGTGAWRNSGKGRFTYEIIDDGLMDDEPVKATEHAPEIIVTNDENTSGETTPAPKKRGRPKKN